VDRFNQEKLYIQLARILQELIVSGQWKLDERIPSEDELCSRFHVSKTTVRQAISNLAAEGYLLKIQGKGTFVTADQPTVSFVMKTRPTEEPFGREADAKRVFISKAEEEPSAAVRAFLRTEGRVLHLRSTTTVAGRTAYLQDSFVPLEILPDVEGRDVAGRSLYEILQQRGRRKIFKVIQTVEIGRAAGEAARELELEDGMPVLLVHRLYVSSDGTPVAYGRIQGRSDRATFQTEFERLH
jgi:GntR family transcriptional regulator